MRSLSPPHSYFIQKMDDAPKLATPTMLFISEGRLTSQMPPSLLCGEIQLRDRENNAVITGIFKKGRCERAEVFRHEESRVSGVEAEVDDKGCLLLGGPHAREEKDGGVVYEGGLAGYVRDGLGVHHYEQSRTETGFWSLGRRQGQFVEEYREKEREQLSLIRYEEGECVEEVLVVVTHESKPPQLKHTVKDRVSGVVVNREDLSEQQVLEWRVKIQTAKHAMKPENRNYLQPLIPATAPRQQRFHFSEVRQEGRLTLDICETYLQWLSHSEDCHYKGRTAVLSIHTACLFDLMGRQEERADNARRQVNHLMHQYRGPYRLLRGFWRSVIIPLVLPKRYNHFSFARVSVLPGRLECTYYDSLLLTARGEEMRQVYFEVIRKALLHELLKDSSNKQAKEAVLAMQMHVDQEFPRQANSDKQSCGFFMLQGVMDLMRLDCIDFHNLNLPIVKDSILKTLREISKQ